MRAWIATAGTLLLLLAAAGLSAASAQDASCRAKQTTHGYHCDTCKRTLKKNDMREGACKRCDEEPRKIEYCLKRHKLTFTSECRHRKKMDQPFRCCGKVWNRYTFVEDLARVSYVCRTCEAKADSRGELAHKEDCNNPFGIDRSCAKSGTKPHVD